MTKRIYNFLFLFILGSALLFPKACIGGTLDNWNNPKAYKPRPVLFLHGYNSSPATWQTAISTLSSLFSKYQPIGAFLETINFQDKTSSIDTCSDGKDGWADRLEKKVNILLADNKYGFYTNKLNLVSHSMGGLAAREFLTNAKYPNETTDKLILIGVPNLGSPLASTYKDIIVAYKIGSMTILPAAVTFFNLRNNVDSLAKILWPPNIGVPEGIKDMIPGSAFLNALNNRSQPSDVQYYGIYGIIGHFLNSLYFKDYYGGDGVVSKDSQLGIGHVAFVKEPKKITAFHTSEPAISVAGDNPLLKFLDSNKPEFEITYPGSGTTEIYESSIHIQGEVYKEYLPADSQLTIDVTRQEDGYTMPPQASFLKASDLWILNKLDSPVAEFDEVINFPGRGTYKISCQIKNPAGLTSAIKDVWVKVIVAEGTNIIVHCHNPEGKEIASIQGIGSNSVQIYDGNTLIGYGAYNAETHNKPIEISAGIHTIKAKFNGLTKEQIITLDPNETKMVTFTFERITHDFKDFWSLSPTGSLSASGNGKGLIGGGIGRYIFNSRLSSPGRYTCCFVGAPVGASIEYDISSSGLVTIGQHSISLKTNLSGTWKRYGGGWIRIQVSGATEEYVHIPNPQLQGFTKWYYQWTNLSDPSYSRVWLRGEENYSKPIHVEEWEVADLYPPVDIIYTIEPDAILSSVPYDLTGSGI